MKRVTGAGGIFFKSDDPEKLYQWYEKHLGVHRGPDGSGATFKWRETNDLSGRFFRGTRNISSPATAHS